MKCIGSAVKTAVYTVLFLCKKSLIFVLNLSTLVRESILRVINSADWYGSQQFERRL